MEGATSGNDELSYHLPVSFLLQPIRDKFPTAFIIHYMDDILLSMKSELCLQQLHNEVTAAASAKSLQSCLTLCNPRDGSPPGSPVPGILQARTLEWVAISFSSA